MPTSLLLYNLYLCSVHFYHPIFINPEQRYPTLRFLPYPMSNSSCKATPVCISCSQVLFVAFATLQPINPFSFVYRVYFNFDSQPMCSALIVGYSSIDNSVWKSNNLKFRKFAELVIFEEVGMHGVRVRNINKWWRNDWFWWFF